MVKSGKVYGTATEDMDALTFGCNVLLRRLTFSEARKMPIQEIQYDKVLNGLGLTRDEVQFSKSVQLYKNSNKLNSYLILYIFQFIDLCIMLGCDYTQSIKGVGPKRAIELIKNHRSLEKILENLDTKKFPVPEDWNYKDARQLFIEPEVKDPEEVDVGSIYLRLSG